MPCGGWTSLAVALVATAAVCAAGATQGEPRSQLHAQVAAPLSTGGTVSRAAANRRSKGAGGHSIKANRAALAGDRSKTTFSLDLSSGVTAEVFSLANPYRVIVDLPDVAFRMPAGTGQKGRGLVSAFRYGLLSEGRARVVLDTSGPVLIHKADMTALKGPAVRLAIELTATTPRIFGAGTGDPATASAADRRERYDVPVVKPKNRTRPVIVIDPGHGGVDPGTISPKHVLEKTVVLAVAKKLKAYLAKSGRYDVHMTRVRDVFVSLDQRLKMSRKLAADLFISLHADAIAQKNFAHTVRGATVYTLSERASDDEARLMAEKENASDAIAGLQSAEIDDAVEVRSILIDLLKRETANFAADFSNTLVKGLVRTISLSRDPQKSAAFKVLKQSNTPSVLLELGYMSHAEDEKLMNSEGWQRKIAASIAGAVDSYFAKRTARAP